MSAFGYAFAAAYVAVTLLASGAGHLLRPRAFAALLRSHGTLPPALAPAAAGLVIAAELLGGIGAAATLLGAGPSTAAVVWGCTALAGAGFFLYVRALLRHPAPASSCGCTPMAAPLTPLSQLPAAGLALASLCGLLALLAPGTGASGAPLALLAAAWGALISMLVMLVPATAPPIGGTR